MTNANQPPITYRQDIDGLRAMAILPVVIYHAFPSSLQGGFAGVDVFFVISGFLISSIILKENENRSFSFVRFYRNRFKRIFPSLLFMIACIFAFGWVMLLADEFRSLGKHVTRGIGFISNFLLYREVSYFDVAAELKPLLHLWSLGIEEQFYLVFPIVIFLLLKVTDRILAILIFLFLLSFGYNTVILQYNPGAAFYFPHARVWELLAGSILALICMKDRDIPVSATQPDDQNAWGFTKTYLPDALSGVGILLLLATFFLFTKDDFPGTKALLPVLGTVALILSGPQALINRIILRNRLLVSIGLISYPLYLWHWPIFSLARITEGGEPSRMIRLLLIALSVFLAVVSTHVVEKSIRFKPTRLKLTLLAVFAVALAGIGSMANKKHLLPRNEELSQYLVAAQSWDYQQGFDRKSDPGSLPNVLEISGTKKTLYIGDSNMQQYASRIARVLRNQKNKERGAVVVAQGWCFPVPGIIRGKNNEKCADLMPKVSEVLEHDHSIDTIVLSGVWRDIALKSQDPDINMNAAVWPTEGFVDGIPLRTDEGREKTYQNLENFIREWRARGKKVILVNSVPSAWELDPRNALTRSPGTLTAFVNFKTGISKERTMGKLKEHTARFERIAAATGAFVFEPADFLCNDGFCPAFDAEGEPIYKDSRHLSPAYVKDKATFFDDIILNRFGE